MREPAESGADPTSKRASVSTVRGEGVRRGEGHRSRGGRTVCRISLERDSR